MTTIYINNIEELFILLKEVVRTTFKNTKIFLKGEVLL